MKILFVTHRSPFPQNGGYPIVVANTLRGLAAQGHQVTLFSLVEEESSSSVLQDNLLNHIDYHPFQLDTSITVLDATIRLLTRHSANIERYYAYGFEKLLVDQIRKNRYDLIQLEGLFVAPYFDALRKASAAKIVYRAHNIEHQVWERLALQKSDPIKRFFIKLIARRVKKYELQRLKNFDGIAAFTLQDKVTLQKHLPAVKIAVIPVSVDLEHYNPQPEKTEFPSLFFLGSLSWMPNREGIKWFLDNFHAELINERVRSRFYLAGNDIPAQFDEYEALGKIFMQGEVDNALEFINSKAIMVVPLLSGGGMRVKIVEGMAMQKCIISTTLGAEGIEYTPGEHIIIADSRDEFMEAMQRCIADEELCLRLGRNARSLVVKSYQIQTITVRLEAFYRRVLSAD